MGLNDLGSFERGGMRRSEGEGKNGSLLLGKSKVPYLKNVFFRVNIYFLTHRETTKKLEIKKGLKFFQCKLSRRDLQSLAVNSRAVYNLGILSKSSASSV